MVPDGSGQTALPPDTKPPNYPDLPGKVRNANTFNSIANTVPKQAISLCRARNRQIIFKRTRAIFAPCAQPEPFQNAQICMVSRFPRAKTKPAHGGTGNVKILHTFVLFVFFMVLREAYPLRCADNNQ